MYLGVDFFVSRKGENFTIVTLMWNNQIIFILEIICSITIIIIIIWSCICFTSLDV
jgi:hypothetical protein